MTETAMSSTAQSRKGLRIFINDQPFLSTGPVMTGAEILALGDLPADNHLFLEAPGPGDDLPIRPDEPIKIRPGMKFYDVPVGTFG